jgi:hypothetical protein
MPGNSASSFGLAVAALAIEMAEVERLGPRPRRHRERHQQRGEPRPARQRPRTTHREPLRRRPQHQCCDHRLQQQVEVLQVVDQRDVVLAERLEHLLRRLRQLGIARRRLPRRHLAGGHHRGDRLVVGDREHAAERQHDAAEPQHRAPPRQVVLRQRVGHRNRQRGERRAFVVGSAAALEIGGGCATEEAAGQFEQAGEVHRRSIRTRADDAMAGTRGNRRASTCPLRPPA